MAQRPDWLQTLLDRPLPELFPPRLTDKQNPPWSRDQQARIADALLHPLLEATLHLMNDDLFSAHFLLRKTQDDQIGKWLHACLHQAEGDLESNARLWYEQTDPKVLSKFWKGADPIEDAVANMRKIGRVRDLGAIKSGEDVKTLRQIRWDELVCIMRHMEEIAGWKEWDGTKVYTSDPNKSSSLVLGEGWRTF